MTALQYREYAGRRDRDGEAPIPQVRPEIARRFLEHLTVPTVECVELRVLRAAWDRRGDLHRADRISPTYQGSTLAGWYDDLARLARHAGRLVAVSGYVTINPVRRDLLARSDNRLDRSRHTTKDDDVTALRWMYLDIDPKRPADMSSTDEELDAAVRRRDSILAGEPEMAAAALWGKSGNGAWILVRLPDYPNDAPHRGLVARTVKALARVYDDDSVIIDTATVNPSRLIGLPGTVKAKGSPRPERPWRRVTFDGAGPLATE
ncbi:hypothetical protein [Planctomyces sp. SH-PL62]|uniref:hypothetical protein n=1 Tax=Planctomyces sp. SH-PL62 TaxID=1636152 RepID=UPI00078E39D8|nr:hypothetical protein [Planctomyces sp. SH-PL62]AMV37382.1 hypothetical protein VT85_08105 [Planctomyces sp. SH-PL62]